jgi:hypothetical protein
MNIQMNEPRDIGIHVRFYVNFCILIGVWHFTKAIHPQIYMDMHIAHENQGFNFICVKIALKY